MANQITIESLELTNFGPFYGSNKIDFRTKKNAPPHVLIGGQNGAGKTHVLRALYLAVAGSAGVVDLKNVEADSGVTRFNFAHLLNRRAKREGEDACSIAVSIIQRDADSGDERSLTLNREIRFRPSSPPDWKSWAKRSDNNNRIEDTDLIERLRDAFLPRHLARFFFFDAEKSQNFQLGEPDIVKGISRILGLWSYEALEEDLRTLVKNTNSQLSATGASNASVKLGEVSGRVIAIKGQIKGVEEERQRLVLQKQEAESSLLDIEDQLKTLGAVDPVKLAENHTRRQEAAEAKRKLESTLEASWELALPIELLGRLRAELRAQLEAEQKRRNWEDRKAAVAPQLPRIQGEVFGEAPADFRLPDATLAFYTSRLDRALRSLFEPPPEGIDQVQVFVTDTTEASIAVRQLLAKGAASLSDIAAASHKLELIEEDVRRLDHEIRQQTQNVAAIGAGQKLHESRAELRATIERVTKEIGDLDANKARLELELTEQMGEEARWAKAVKDADRGRDLAARASAYREAASELRKRASDRMRPSSTNSSASYGSASWVGSASSSACSLIPTGIARSCGRAARKSRGTTSTPPLASGRCACSRFTRPCGGWRSRYRRWSSIRRWAGLTRKSAPPCSTNSISATMATNPSYLQPTRKSTPTANSSPRFVTVSAGPILSSRTANPTAKTTAWSWKRSISNERSAHELTRRTHLPRRT